MHLRKLLGLAGLLGLLLGLLGLLLLLLGLLFQVLRAVFEVLGMLLEVVCLAVRLVRFVGELLCKLLRCMQGLCRLVVRLVVSLHSCHFHAMAVAMLLRFLHVELERVLRLLFGFLHGLLGLFHRAARLVQSVLADVVMVSLVMGLVVGLVVMLVAEDDGPGWRCRVMRRVTFKAMQSFT